MEMDWVVGANLDKGKRFSITCCVQHQGACCWLIARHFEAKYVRRPSQRSLADREDLCSAYSRHSSAAVDRLHVADTGFTRKST